MYKVFVNDRPIIFTSSTERKYNFSVYEFSAPVLHSLIYKLKDKEIEGAYIYTTDLYNEWNSFRNLLDVIIAGGGLVLNKAKDFLFIYRGNKWDLPKGRLEEEEHIEEAAIREVEEECGITDIHIEKFLLKTYHIFFYNGAFRLKETFWYLMHTNYSGNLTPQLEEGITDVKFLNSEGVKEAFKNTYANIKMVFESYTS